MRTRSWRAEAAGRRRAIVLVASLACAAARSHELGASAFPELPGWRAGAAVALVAPAADERWPAAYWPGVLVNGSAPRDQRGGLRLEHATLDLAARLDARFAAHVAVGWHDRDSAYVEAARLQGRFSAGPDEVEFVLGRDTVSMGAAIDRAGHFDRFSLPPLAKRAIVNDQWIDDGLRMAWRRNVEDGVRAVELGYWRGQAFPGGPGPTLHMNAGWGDLDVDLSLAHLEPQGRGAAAQSAGSSGHVHGNLDCSQSLQQRVCFDGRVDVIGGSVQWQPEAGAWSFGLAGMAKRERGELYSLSGDADYRSTVSGFWADAVWRPAARWTLSGRAERLVPSNRLEGIGATLLAREAGLENATPVNRLTLAAAYGIAEGLQLGFETGTERSAAGRVSHVALRLVWLAPRLLGGAW